MNRVYWDYTVSILLLRLVAVTMSVPSASMNQFVMVVFNAS